MKQQKTVFQMFQHTKKRTEKTTGSHNCSSQGPFTIYIIILYNNQRTSKKWNVCNY